MATKSPKCPKCAQMFRPNITESFLAYRKRTNTFTADLSNAPKDSLTHLTETTVKVSNMELGKLGRMLTQMLAKISGPAYWDKLKPGENDALVELPPWSAEYKEALRLFRKTVTNKTMVKIQRVQNAYLYQKYIVRKIQMVSRNNGVVNERLLFHGTRAALPSYIWDGLNAGGFDPRLGKGYYGIGAYFAEKANYSLGYQYVIDVLSFSLSLSLHTHTYTHIYIQVHRSRWRLETNVFSIRSVWALQSLRNHSCTIAKTCARSTKRTSFISWIVRQCSRRTA